MQFHLQKTYRNWQALQQEQSTPRVHSSITFKQKSLFTSPSHHYHKPLQFHRSYWQTIPKWFLNTGLQKGKKKKKSSKIRTLRIFSFIHLWEHSRGRKSKRSQNQCPCLALGTVLPDINFVNIYTNHLHAPIHLQALSRWNLEPGLTLIPS